MVCNTHILLVNKFSITVRVIYIIQTRKGIVTCNLYGQIRQLIVRSQFGTHANWPNYRYSTAHMHFKFEMHFEWKLIFLEYY